MGSTAKIMTVTLISSLLLFGFMGVGFGKLPQTLELDCQKGAYLYKNGDLKTPPNEECLGRYKGHVYLLESPKTITELAAKVTGGIPESKEIVGGFKLQYLPLLPPPPPGEKGEKLRKQRKVRGLLGQAWKTLSTFSAPCTSGSKELVHWKGDSVQTVALRIEAPEGHYVDYSQLWVEHY